jgi:GntR family transcriptional regulator of arabinose operon
MMLDLELVKNDLAKSGSPLYVRLRNAIQEQIRSGMLVTGAALPPEREMEQRLGVSRSTVRQALRSLIDEGVLKSVVGSGTYVNSPAAERGSSLIGLIMPDPSFFMYYAQFASTLNSLLREAGYRMDMGLHNQKIEELSSLLDSLLAQNVAALALSPLPDKLMFALMDKLAQRSIPSVMVVRYIDYPGVDFIGADNERIGYDATRHLIDMGHKGIVHFTGLYGSTGRDRAAGYLRAMLEAGLQPLMFLVDVGRSVIQVPEFEPYINASRNFARLWVATARREITAGFCFNDDIAVRVYTELRKVDLRVPDDISLVGVDHLPYSKFFDAPLTSFALDGEEIARRAAERLIARLNGDTAPAQRIFIPARFMEGKSVLRIEEPVAHPWKKE